MECTTYEDVARGDWCIMRALQNSRKASSLNERRRRNDAGCIELAFEIDMRYGRADRSSLHGETCRGGANRAFYTYREGITRST